MQIKIYIYRMLATEWQGSSTSNVSFHFVGIPLKSQVLPLLLRRHPYSFGKFLILEEMKVFKATPLAHAYNFVNISNLPQLQLDY